MNRTKLTPCRNVGLSRKKNTPNRTVDSLLTKSEISQDKQESKNIVSNCSHPIESNYDTPCRQVGLSRKRKTITPLSDTNSRIKVSTTLQDIPDNTSLKSTLIDVTNKRNHQIYCTSQLSKKVSTSTEDFCQKSQLPEVNLHNSDSIVHEVLISKSPLSNVDIDDSYVEKIVECDEKKIIPEKFNNLNNELNGNRNICYAKDFAINNTCDNPFIKVCYENKAINSIQNTKTMKAIDPKKPKFNRKIFDDDEDDFEVSTKQLKSKNIFSRYETDVVSLQKRLLEKESLPLKKTLSLGDIKRKYVDDSNEICSKSSIPDCYVKINKLKDELIKSPKGLTSQELSDDDFQMLGLTPPNIKSKIKDLEKQIKEKKIIIEELERAKIYKKMHDTNLLKTLTSTWENGCKQALVDLLEKLNSHSVINMNMLLKKLNIPEDFIPSSQ